MDITLLQFVQLLFWSVIVASPFIVAAIINAQQKQKIMANSKQITHDDWENRCGH